MVKEDNRVFEDSCVGVLTCPKCNKRMKIIHKEDDKRRIYKHKIEEFKGEFA